LTAQFKDNDQGGVEPPQSKVLRTSIFMTEHARKRNMTKPVVGLLPLYIAALKLRRGR
jgi:hypothetical protein